MKKIVFGLILGLVSFNSFGAAVCLNTSTGQIVTKPRCKGVFQNFNFSPIAGPQGIPGPAGESGKVLPSACKAEDIVGKWGFDLVISHKEFVGNSIETSFNNVEKCVLNVLEDQTLNLSCKNTFMAIGNGGKDFSIPEGSVYKGDFFVNEDCSISINFLRPEYSFVFSLSGTGFISPDRNLIPIGIRITRIGLEDTINSTIVRIP